MTTPTTPDNKTAQVAETAYPELPAPKYLLPTGGGWMAPTDGFTAEQMHAYVDADRAARLAPVVAEPVAMNLPRLPEPKRFFGHSDKMPMYTAEELREYGASCVGHKASAMPGVCEPADLEAWARDWGDVTTKTQPDNGTPYLNLSISLARLRHALASLTAAAQPSPTLPAQPTDRPKKLIGWRSADFIMETADPDMAKNWSGSIEVLPIFEGDANTKLYAAPLLPAPAQPIYQIKQTIGASIWADASKTEFDDCDTEKRVLHAAPLPAPEGVSRMSRTERAELISETYDLVAKISGSALLAGEECPPTDKEALYKIACEALQALYCLRDDAQRYPSLATPQPAQPATAPESFEDWWQTEGQYCRAGGGDYEKTFAFRAWQARHGHPEYLIRARWPDGVEEYLKVRSVYELGEKLGIDVDAPKVHPVSQQSEHGGQVAVTLTPDVIAAEDAIGGVIAAGALFKMGALDDMARVAENAKPMTYGNTPPAPEGLPFGIIDPDYARVFTQARIIAWQYGYACVMHGSFTRDLDLLLVPWEVRARDNHSQLLKMIAQSSGLRFRDGKEDILESTVDFTDKAHGRKACSLFFPAFGDCRWVDISIMPTAPPAAPQGAVQECQWKPDEDGNWWTGCGEGHVFTDGGPKENSYKFCCYCGNGLVIAAQGGDKP